MPARFVVLEDDCMGCGLCEQRAPENLEMVDDDDVARVYSQPVNTTEEEACFEAVDYCPIGALFTADPDSSDEYPSAVNAAAAAK